MAGSDDLPLALGRFAMQDEPDPPALSGPFASPIDRFAHLPANIRAWMESLREDDIAKLRELGRFSSEDLSELREAIRFQRSAKTIGRFGKWVLITIVSTVIATVTFGEKIAAAWKWWIAR